jgi:hypothetical protein
LIQRISNLLGEKNDGKIQVRELFMNGVLLKDQLESIATYRIFGSMLTYRTHKRLTLFVKTLTGKTITLECHTGQTIRGIKDMIRWKEGMVGCGILCLSFAGVDLQDNMTLRTYNIQTESTFFLRLKLEGGGPSITAPGGLMFADVSDAKSVRKIGLARSGPRGRSVHAGTNVECDCNCTPSYRVICRKDFGTIELSDTPFVCPKCGRDDNIVPITVGFLRCKYRFHGIKSSGQRYTSEWKKVTKDDLYQQFSPSNQTTWKRLVIESVELDSLEECAICLEPMRTIKTLVCGHRFHEACYKKWIPSCPLCRFNEHLNAYTITARAARKDQQPY